MARITVEDCIVHIPNRYELVVIAAQRAKNIAAGSPLTLDRDNDKDAVVALREIAEQTISLDAIREEVVQTFSKVQPMDRIERKTAGDEEELLAEVEEDLKEAQGTTGFTGGDKGGMSFIEENIEVDD